MKKLTKFAVRRPTPTVPLRLHSSTCCRLRQALSTTRSAGKPLAKHHTTRGGYQGRNAIDTDAPVSRRLRRIFSNSSTHRRFPSPAKQTAAKGPEASA